MFEFQLSNAFVSVARMRARVGAPLIPSLSLSLSVPLPLSFSILSEKIGCERRCAVNGQ